MHHLTRMFLLQVKGGVRAVVAHLAAQPDPVWKRHVMLLELNGEWALVRKGHPLYLGDSLVRRAPACIGAASLISGRQPLKGPPACSRAASFSRVRQPVQGPPACPAAASLVQGGPPPPSADVPSTERVITDVKASDSASLSYQLALDVAKLRPRESNNIEQLDSAEIAKSFHGSVLGGLVPQLDRIWPIAVAESCAGGSASGYDSSASSAVSAGSCMRLSGRGIVGPGRLVLCRAAGRYIKVQSVQSCFATKDIQVGVHKKVLNNSQINGLLADYISISYHSTI